MNNKDRVHQCRRAYEDYIMKGNAMSDRVLGSLMMDWKNSLVDYVAELEARLERAIVLDENDPYAYPPLCVCCGDPLAITSETSTFPACKDCGANVADHLDGRDDHALLDMESDGTLWPSDWFGNWGMVSTEPTGSLSPMYFFDRRNLIIALNKFQSRG